MEKLSITPKVSIVIPVYNGSDYLAEAIDSALAQTYINTEVIVINDGSNDEGKTDSTARSYGSRIRYCYKENGGVASALNHGILKMKGDYFSWLSHDDLYEPTKIEDEIALICSLNRDNVVVVSNARVLFRSGIKKKTLINSVAFASFEVFLAMDAEVGINGCSLLIPKRALLDSGGFDVHLPVTQDYDLWYRLSRKFKYEFVLLEKQLVVYRRHDGQDSVKKQQLCLEAGDSLRQNILHDIGYNRFKEYIVANKQNLSYALKNYELYKERRHLKTASIMLRNFLKYYYEYDRRKFYKLYLSEFKTKSMNKNRGPLHILSQAERTSIENKYRSLLKNKLDILPIKEPRTAASVAPKGRALRAAWTLRQSLDRDGILLTAAKGIRIAGEQFRKKSSL